MRKLNILQVNTGKIWSGAENHMYDLSRMLKAKGHIVRIACKKDRAIAHNLAGKDLPLEYIPSGLGAVPYLVKAIRKYDIQIIQAHSGKDFWPSVLAAKISGKAKVILTRHIIRPLKKNFLNSLLVKMADHFIAVSCAVADSLIEHNQVRKDLISVVYNGIDLEKNQLITKKDQSGQLRKKYDIAIKSNLIGCIGRLDQEKGQRDLIKAFPLVLEKYPNAKLILVGHDMTGGVEKTYLERLVQSLDLEKHIFFTGYCSNVTEIMAELDVFVLPSREEPFGLVILEAMAQETPVVATRSGGVPEIIKDGETGILVDVGDREQLAGAITLLLNNNIEAKKIAKKARQELIKNYSLDVMVNKVEDIYYQLIVGE